MLKRVYLSGRSVDPIYTSTAYFMQLTDALLPMRFQFSLQPILTDWYLPQGLLQAAYPSRRGLLPAVRVFLDFLSDHARYEAWQNQVK